MTATSETGVYPGAAGGCAVGVHPGAWPAKRRGGGLPAYLRGLEAEERVVTWYEAAGGALVARRWRSRHGEIDLVIRLHGCLVFVEVKRARSHGLAGARLQPRQMRRIMNAALDYLMREAGRLEVAMRFDVALVDANGDCQVLENAFGAEMMV